MVDQVFNKYTARGYEGDLVDSGHAVKQTGILLAGTLGFGKAVQISGTGQGIAVERNREVVRRAEYAACVLQPGDEVEIVRLVGGG